MPPLATLDRARCSPRRALGSTSRSPWPAEGRFSESPGRLRRLTSPRATNVMRDGCHGRGWAASPGRSSRPGRAILAAGPGDPRGRTMAATQSWLHATTPLGRTTPRHRPNRAPSVASRDSLRLSLPARGCRHSRMRAPPRSAAPPPETSMPPGRGLHPLPPPPAMAMARRMPGSPLRHARTAHAAG